MIEFKNLQSVLEELGKAIKLRYQENLIESDRKASYNLIGSIQYQTVINGQELAIDLELADYWKYVEDDTRPHWPPVDKILEWVRIKPVLPTPLSNGKLPTEKQLAFLISRKISEVGTTGSHDLERTLEEIDQEWEERIEEAIDQDIDECFDELVMILE